MPEVAEHRPIFLRMRIIFASSLLIVLIGASIHDIADAGDSDLAEFVEEFSKSRGLSTTQIDRMETAEQSDLLFAAVLRGEVDVVRTLIDAGVSSNIADANGWTALMLALLAGQEEVALVLIDDGADATAVADDGTTAADLAELTGSSRVLWALAAAAGSGETGRLMAVLARRGDLAGIDAALEQGVSADARDPMGQTPLLNALAYGRIDVVHHLLDRGADPNAADSDGLVPLAIAILAQETSAFEALIAFGADPSAQVDGVPLLNLALAAGMPDVIEPLLQAGADPTLADHDGTTAAQIAMVLGLDDVARRLGGDPDRLPTQDRLLAAIRADDAEAVRDVITAGLSPDSPFDDGVRPLTAALVMGHAEAAATLVRLGAADRVDGETISAQDIAREKQFWNILAMLPDDRRFGFSVQKGMSRENRQRLQAKLQEWGYYTGAIDGVLGAGSVAALNTFFQARQNEIIAMAEAASQESGWLFDDGDDWRSWWQVVDGQAAHWWVHHWSTSEQTFVGFTEGPATNGIGLLTRADGGSDVYLFGPNGWQDPEILR